MVGITSHPAKEGFTMKAPLPRGWTTTFDLDAGGAARNQADRIRAATTAAGANGTIGPTPGTPPPASPGAALFLRAGCGGCHTLAASSARGGAGEGGDDEEDDD